MDIRMKLGDSGEAFFVEELEEGDEVSGILGTSPLPAPRSDGSQIGSPRDDDQRSQDSGVEAEDASIAALKEPSKPLKRLTNSQRLSTPLQQDPDVGVVFRILKKYPSDPETSPGTKDMALQVELEPCTLDIKSKSPTRENSIDKNSRKRSEKSMNGINKFQTDARDSKTDSEAVVKSKLLFLSYIWRSAVQSGIITMHFGLPCTGLNISYSQNI